jgi:hypothetical protein
MKHILNDLTEIEKNSIREQHTGGMKVTTDNFSRLINSKSGEVKTIVNEQVDGNTISTVLVSCFQEHFENPNMTLPTSCEELAKEIMESKKLPLDIAKFTACSSELSKSVGTDIFSTMGKLKDVGECIIKKAGSPVKI